MVIGLLEELEAEPGEFEVFIGGNSRDLKTAKFNLQAIAAVASRNANSP